MGFLSNIFKSKEQKEREVLISQAENGDAEAAYQLFREEYDNVSVSEANAKWLRLGAENGSSECQFFLGVYFQLTIKDYAKAFKWYKIAADNGNYSAQNNVGIFYSHGIGIQKNIAEAIKYYTLAANQGHKMAQHNLGMSYWTAEENGNPELQDDKKAIELFTAASDEYPASRRMLAEAYQKGRVVEKNLDKAIELYSSYLEAAQYSEEELADVLGNIGNCYEEQGETHDLDSAADYYWQSLGHCDDHEPSISGLKRLAEKGNAAALERLALYYIL